MYQPIYNIRKSSLPDQEPIGKLKINKRTWDKIVIKDNPGAVIFADPGCDGNGERKDPFYYVLNNCGKTIKRHIKFAVLDIPEPGDQKTIFGITHIDGDKWNCTHSNLKDTRPAEYKKKLKLKNQLVPLSLEVYKNHSEHMTSQFLRELIYILSKKLIKITNANDLQKHSIDTLNNLLGIKDHDSN